ncbi:MAG: DNA-3-methyladenine glycosylase [Bryobacteraceae bacterium]
MREISIAELAARSDVLEQEFFARPAAQVARDCLGKVLVHGTTAGRIVEVEAYLGASDLAAHASRGITDRTRVLFGPPGHAYVYFIYGMYECLNFVAEPEGQAGCVLIRALEPLTGLSVMQRRRPAARRTEDLAAGPGRLTLAMAITRRLNGCSLTSGPLQVRTLRSENAFEIAVTPRIGIKHCADWPLRFLIAGNRFVSRAKPLPLQSGS